MNHDPTHTPVDPSRHHPAAARGTEPATGHGTDPATARGSAPTASRWAKAEASTPARSRRPLLLSRGASRLVVTFAWALLAPALAGWVAAEEPLPGSDATPLAGIAPAPADDAPQAAAPETIARDGQPMPPLELVARDPDGHGLLARSQGKTFLIVSGTPEQMGRAHGALLAEPVRKLVERVVYLVGGADSVDSGVWFLDRMAEIERRAAPHIPDRFLRECDAMSAAAGISRRDGRYANLFPERFHCSGVAVRGKASLGGRVLHARVLDYMRDIRLQQHALVAVFVPDDRNAWMSLGYAGFIGTVTAMNCRGLAVGEMGGRGEGLWDGEPMSLLLREMMEDAGSVDEALALLRRKQRTCEYYYVLSDRSGAMCAVYATPERLEVLEPGQQHPQLPHVPDDTVFVSGPGRAETLSKRLLDAYGRIDVPAMIELIRRPVAMSSNLHNAIFAPQSGEMWFADAGETTPACDEPYARCRLDDLLRFHREQQPSR